MATLLGWGRGSPWGHIPRALQPVGSTPRAGASQERGSALGSVLELQLKGTCYTPDWLGGTRTNLGAVGEDGQLWRALPALGQASEEISYSTQQRQREAWRALCCRAPSRSVTRFLSSWA